jgi:hypothetical protein
MTAIGFGSPKNLKGADGVTRPLISLRALADAATVHKKLPSEIVERLQLKRNEVDAEIIALDGAPSVAAVVRTMCDKHGASATRGGVETALAFVSNVLTTPGDLRMYRVKKTNPLFLRTLGNLEGCELLMRSIGFFGASDAVIGGGMGLNPPTIVAYVLRPIGEDGFDPTSAVAIENGSSNIAGTVVILY